MKLKLLASAIEGGGVIHGPKDLEITQLVAHSQAVGPGALFIAKKGLKSDGNEYVREAISSGAVAVVSTLYNPSLSGVTQIIVSDIAAAEARLAARFYGEPSEKLQLFGITGTSGKTTTAYLIRHLLKSLEVNAGLIGTVSYIFGESEIAASRTTPDVLMNHKMLRDMVKSRDTAAVLEVTSHALDQGRVLGVDFDVAIFTNLSHEHLDYHKTMEAYAKTKKKLFDSLNRGKKRGAAAVLNRQDPFADLMRQHLLAEAITYGIDDPEADIEASRLSLSAHKTSFDLKLFGKTHHAETLLPGRFNVMNILAAFGALISRGYDIHRLLEGLKTFQGPPGRLERVPNGLNISIFVDYAHKEDALRKVLPALRQCTPGRLITVFGCGGDRDREKRPLMARAVEELSDISIVTSDNPRSEEPLMIIDEIVRGFQRGGYIVEVDRRRAIDRAIEIAEPGDTILIAGKGHEKQQIFRHAAMPFDDRLVALEACNKRAGI